MIRVAITGSDFSAADSQSLQLGEHVVGLDQVRIELDLEGGVGRADLGDALDLGVAHRIGDGQALEESLERHGLVHLDEDVLVAAEGKSSFHGAVTSCYGRNGFLAVVGVICAAGTPSAAARLAACDASHGSSQAV